MPKINITRTRGGIPTTSGLGQAAPLPNIPNPIVETIGSISKELQGFVAEEAAKVKRTRDLDYVTSAHINVTEQTASLRRNLQTSREGQPVGYTDAFIQGLDQLHKDAIDNAPSQEARNALTQRFGAQRNNQFLSAFKFESEQTERVTLEKATENIDILANDIRNNPGNLASREQEIESVIEGIGIFGDEAKSEFSKAARRTLADAQIKGLIGQDPEKVSQQLKAGIYDGVITAAKKDQYLRAAKAQAEGNLRIAAEELSTTKKQAVDQRRLEIFQGTANQLSLDEDLDNGVYGISEYLSLSKELAAKIGQANTITQTIGEVEDAIASGRPLDVTNATDREKLDTYFETIVMKNIDEETISSADAVASHLKQFNHLPKVIKNNLVANLYNGSNQEVINSAVLIDRLIVQEPNVARQFNSRQDLARVTKLVNSVNAGLPIDDAVKAADNLLVEKNTTEHKDRQDNYFKNSNEFDQDEITSFFINDPDTVPTGMVNDWKRLYQTYAIDHKMDLVDAEALAYKITKSRWSITNINGDEEYMKDAPENYYNQRGLNPDWMQSQLKTDLTGLLPETNRGFFITPEPTTINSGRPGYVVYYEDENGMPTLLLDEDNDVMLWRPDITTSSDAQQQIQEATREAREKRLSAAGVSPAEQASMFRIKALADTVNRMKEGE